MVNKKLADWINSEKAQGYSKEQLRQYLTKQGYNKKDIEEALSYTGERQSLPFINKKAIFIAIPIIILILVGYSIYMLNLEEYMNDQDTLVYGQNDFAPGSEAALRIVTLNHKNSEPITGAAVTIAARDKDTKQKIVLFEGKTDEQGSPDIEFEIPEELEGEYELIITTNSKYGKDEIIKPIKIERTYKILLTTDKPLYQPGQTMHIRALSLQNSDSSPAQAKEVTIEVEDSKGNKVFKKKITSSVYGIVGTDFTLANEIDYGRYTIRASIGDYSAEKKVEVKKYVLPKFKVSFDTEKSYYLPNQKLVGTVNADYFFGKPTNNAEVDVKIYTYEVNMEEIGNLHGMTDSSGVYRFEFDLPSHFIGLPLEKGSGLIFFNISVTDQAKHTEQITSSVPIAEEPIEIELIPESGELEKGVENIVYVITIYPDGKPAPSTVTIKGQQIHTNSYGLGEFKITPDNFFVEMQATAQDSKGNQGSADVQFPRDYVKSPQTDEEYRRNQRIENDRYRTESVLLRVDKSILNVGDTVHLDVFYTGSKGTVYIDVIKDKQTILTKSLDVTNGRASLELDLDQSMAGTLELHAYKILRDSNIVRDTRSIFVNQRKDIELDIKPGKETYLPGEEAQITFQTTKDNAAIPAAIGVNIVDESVFALQEKESGFEKLYFELEEELMKPRYMIYGITLPELIYEPQPMLDEKVRTQAGNILMAAAAGEDRFSLKTSSRVEKEQEIERKKDDYFGALFKFTNLLLILIPISILALAFYGHRYQKKNLLKDFGLSIPLLLGTAVLIGVLFWIFALIANSVGYNQRNSIYTIEVVILIITLISTIVLSVWSRKKEYFKTFFISTMLIPIQLALMFMPLMEVVNYRYNELIMLAVPILVLIAIIYSLVVLIRYAKNNDTNLLWITLLFLLYVILFPAFIFIGVYSGLLENLKTMLWVGIATLIIPIIYGIYAVDFLRLKDKLAVPSLLIAFMLLLLPLGSTFLILMSGSQMGRVTDMGGMVPMAGMVRTDINNMEKQAFMDEEISLTGEESEDSETPRVRQFFPETLYSNPQIITDNNGKATLNLEMADSITSWRITALANSLGGDIGSNNAEMIVFQDFFVDIDLPISLTQGDEVSIPISVFNYLKTQQSVRLEFQEEAWFELLDESTKTLDIGANDIDVVYFRIKVKKLGNQKLTVFAYGTQKSDAISRIIEIAPDGQEFRTSFSDKLNSNIEKTIIIPESAIDDSEKLFVKVYPGIFSQVVEGLDSMLRMPYGCFEQTSSITYPNVLIVDYMKTTNQITPEIQFKAEHYIGTGYQRLMTFEATSGGFSIFGKQPAEKIVTAYGLLEFKDMADVYEIDDGLIPRVQDWLVRQMQGDHWTPDGHYGAAYKARNSDVAATCYISWSLLNSGVSNKDEKMKKALDYIEKNYESEKDNPYALGLCALALSKGRRNAEPILSRLDVLAKRDDKRIYWTSDLDSHGQRVERISKISPEEQADVETTAVVALAYLEADYKPNDLTKVLQFLINSKDSYGTWGSTQATVLTMKALLSSIEKSQESTNAKISVFVDDKKIKDISVNNENNDVLQLIDLKEYAKKGETRVKITIEGEGNLFYQIVSSYYLDWSDEIVLVDLGKNQGIDIQLNYDKTNLASNDIVKVKVGVKYDGVGIVNYAIVDLGIPPGFSIFSEDLDKLKQDGLIEKYDITGRQIILYLENLSQQGMTFEYRLKAKYPIKAKTPKSVVYDYYNPDMRDEEEPVEIIVV
ncbi:MAG: MG2 domain-containing protein [Candidatus Woesearchaeota archaeon]